MYVFRSGFNSGGPYILIHHLCPSHFKQYGVNSQYKSPLTTPLTSVVSYIHLGLLSPHCDWCPAVLSCPAVEDLIGVLLASPSNNAHLSKHQPLISPYFKVLSPSVTELQNASRVRLVWWCTFCKQNSQENCGDSTRKPAEGSRLPPFGLWRGRGLCVPNLSKLTPNWDIAQVRRKRTAGLPDWTTLELFFLTVPEDRAHLERGMGGIKQNKKYLFIFDRFVF